MQIRKTFSTCEESRGRIAQCVIFLVKEHIEFTCEFMACKLQDGNDRMSILTGDIQEDWIIDEVLKI